MLERCCKALTISKPNIELKRRLERLGMLTPGDFSAVNRQARLCGLTTAEHFVHALEEDVSLKRGSQPNVLGFV